MQNIDVLKALAYRGQPLEVEITLEEGWEPSGNPPEHRYGMTVRGHTGTGTQIEYGSWAKNLAGAEKEFAETLQFYPDRVTLNGTEMETRDWNDMATLEVTTFKDNEGRSYATDYITPGGNWTGLRANALTAGVMTYVFDNHREEHTYHADMEGEHPHWNLARKVVVQPINVVTAQELDRMTQKDLENLTERMRNGEEPEIARRTQEQIRRTLEHPDAPTAYQGEVYRYADVGPGGDDLYFNKGAPVIAHGPPVSFWDMDSIDDNPEIVSIIDAMYASDQGMVPVRLNGEQYQRGIDDQVARVLEYSVKIEEERETQSSYIFETDSVTFQVQMEGEDETREVSARAYMTHGPNGRKVLYTQEMTDHHELAEVMLRAFFCSSEGHEWGEVKDEVRDLGEEFTRDADAAMGNPEGALRNTMQNAANTLETRNKTRIPQETITVVSRDGQFTITSTSQG